MARDDFNASTKDVLAKRVGFICSNPSCRKHTIGPNSDPEKATSIGKAAHITAASKNGPRYDETMSIIDRKAITNAIWLCSNCADLIDKDENEFTVQKLYEWKATAEHTMRLLIYAGGQIKGVKKPDEWLHADGFPEIVRPNIDIDLIWQFGGRWNKGFSPKNEYEYIKEYNGNVLITDPPIIFWELSWNFRLAIYNNSSIPIINLKIQKDGDIEFDYLSGLPNKNNIPPLQNIDLEARFADQIEATYVEADKILIGKVPSQLEGLKLKLAYQDEKGNDFVDIFQIENLEMIRI